MKNSLFPSVREAVLVIVITAFFLILTAVCIGLRPEHFLMAGVFLVLFFAGQTTRKLAVALLPFFIFGISYDWMRVYPNYQVNPIDVKGLYEAEKSLFGLSVDGAVLIPCEYFALNHCPVADFFAGIFYLCWVPVPIAFGLWLYLKGDRKVYLRFAMVFLLVNLIGFAGYYIHPAAPPWYAMNYGFEPILDTPGNVAGLGRFDELLGCSIFNSIYGRNANVFAAVPSLHAAYMVVALAYAVMDRSKKWLIALFDMMDGRVARVGKMSSTFGALYDSVLDRYSELVTLFGIFYYLMLQGYLWGSIITFIALIGSLMVSYVRARAEGLGLECKVGFMQRPERVVLTALGAMFCGIFGDCTLFDPMLILIVPMAVIAILANLTAFARLAHCYKLLKDKE